MTGPWKRRVEIGPLRGLSPCGFLLHVARLAKADEIASDVCQVGGRKVSKRLDVVNGQRRTHVLPAVGTLPILFSHNGCSRHQPALAPISPRPANVARGLIRAKASRGREARARAKFRDAVLSRVPRLLEERPTAVLANSRVSLLPSGVRLSRDGFAGERVRRPFPNSEKVARHVGLRPDVQPDFSVPRPATLLRTKPRSVAAVGLYAESAPANFASLFNGHGETYREQKAASIDFRTTDIAVERIEREMRQPRLDLPAPPKPEQETMQL